MHLNPKAPHYYPSPSPPPPPPPPPYIHTYVCYFPPRLPFPFIPFRGSPLPATHITEKKEKKERLVWLPKESFTSASKFLSATPVANPIRATALTHLDFDSAGAELVREGTTIMIRNIPNKMTREMLIQMLDEHCAELEERLDKAKVHEKKSFAKSEYDFVYLPIDFSTRANKGYAFVNFTTAEAARDAYEKIHYRKWIIFNSNKVARVCFARIQGRIALVERFKCTQFRCNTDGFLPAVFTPPRNGTTSLSPPLAIGKRLIHSDCP